MERRRSSWKQSRLLREGINQMSHFLFVRDEDEVLGVWEASDEVAALKMRLSLQLTYPACTTHCLAALSFEDMKAKIAGLDIGAVEPENCLEGKPSG